MFRAILPTAAAVAALTLGFAGGVHAQSNARYDGYCYVRSADMARNTTSDSYGGSTASAQCLNGEYYAYTDSYKAAPAAPRGYQIEYFTHRPSHDIYDAVYNASTLTQNFDPGAQNRFNGGGQSTYDSDNGYAANSDQPDQSQYQSSQYSQSPYGQSDSGYANNAGQRSGQGAYNSLNNGGAAPSGYAYGSGGQGYYSDQQPGAVADQDRYSHQGYSNQGDDDRASVTGWRDENGQWHTGKPAAIGWRDTNGRWHVGRFAASGWQDAQGQWHEDATGDGNQDNY